MVQTRNQTRQMEQDFAKQVSMMVEKVNKKETKLEKMRAASKMFHYMIETIPLIQNGTNIMVFADTIYMKCEQFQNKYKKGKYNDLPIDCVKTFMRRVKLLKDAAFNVLQKNH